MAKEIRSAGTELYIVDNTLATPKLVKADVISSLSGVGAGSNTKIDVTRLSERVAKQTMTGLKETSDISIPFLMTTEEGGHRLFKALQDAGLKTQFVICLSDGTDAPTFVNDVITLPNDRTCAQFDASVSELTVDAAEDDAVKGSVTLTVSGDTIWTYKS